MRHRRLPALIAAAAVVGAVLLTRMPAVAAEFMLPETAERTASISDPLNRYAIAIGGFSRQTDVPRLAIVGHRSRDAWQIPAADLSVGAVADVIHDQLEAQGLALRYRCAAVECGGFDFRFQLAVLPLPEMFVDLGDYIYLSAAREISDTNEPDHLVEAVVSRAEGRIYVQINQIAASREAPPPLAPATTGAPAAREHATAEPGEMIATLRSTGHMVIPGLSFETGSSRLTGDTPPVLSELGSLLASQPELRIVLVGHTDSVGSLASNVALSRARARAVADKLVAMPGVAAAQVTADGAGYLAPISSNETEAGRALNRRVEVVILSGSLRDR